MMHVDLLKLALIVALSSNAILLGVLLVKTTGGVFGTHYECCQPSVMVTESGRKNKNDLPGDPLPIYEGGGMSEGYGGSHSGFKKPVSTGSSSPTSNEHSLLEMGNDLEDTRGETSQYKSKNADQGTYGTYSKLHYSNDDDISNTEFHSQLKRLQQKRILEIQKVLRYDNTVRGFKVFRINSQENSRINPLSSSREGLQRSERIDGNQGQRKIYLSNSLLNVIPVRTKRSHRSDVPPEPETNLRPHTESPIGSPRRRAFRRNGNFAERRGRNTNGTISAETRPNRFRDNGERSFRRASRIAKRRMSKGKKFLNKKMRRVNEMKKIFSTLSDEQVSKMSDMVTNVLLPSLVQFEDLVGRHTSKMTKTCRHITGIRSAMVKQELRIERLEQTAMDMAEHKHESPQNDEVDNLTDGKGDEIKDGVEETLMSGNISIRVTVFGKDEGSGDDEDLDLLPVYEKTVTTSPSTTTTTTPSTTTTKAPTTTTTSTPPPTTTATTTTTTTTTTSATTTLKTTTKPPQSDANYEELYMFYSSLNQKVDDMQNYNMLRSTELHRTQSIAIKMDDKVTELERRFKNMKTRDSRQLYRINELEIENSRITSNLQKALKDFEKIEERFDYFRDHMDTFKNNVHKVNSEFTKYEQISDELRAADAYKAHDITDIRESVMNVENRVNGLYRVLDEGAVKIRYEMEDMLQRVCVINKLIC